MVKIKEYFGKIQELSGYKIFITLLIIGLILLLCGKYMGNIKSNFSSSDKETLAYSATKSEQEKKLAEILSEMEGVGEVEVIINTKDKTSSVLVLATGASDPETYIRIKRAVSTVMQTENKNIKIEKKKS